MHIRFSKGINTNAVLFLLIQDDSELEAAERSCESQASEDSASEIVEEKSKSNKSQVVGKSNMGIIQSSFQVSIRHNSV